MTGAELTGRWLAAAGAALVIFSSATAGGLPALGFAVWALLPYACLFFLGRLWKDSWAVGGAGIAIISGEVGFRAAVFIFPAGSTAGIALIYSPLTLCFAVLPAGAVVGWIIGRSWRSSRWLGVPALITGSALLAVFALSLARPDLAPTTVWRRSALLNEIGEPRVVVNLNDTQRDQVTEELAVFQTAEVDGLAGDEIVVISDDVQLLDPMDFQVRDRLGARKVYWNWYSVLVHLGDRIVVVQTGGAYQETEVLELDGRRLWRYRPDPEMNPFTLRPADLDRDGLIEFYSVAGSRVVRLDEQGQEVWSRAVRYRSRLLLSGPRMQHDPAWVTACQRDGTYMVWDEAGNPLAELPSSEQSGNAKIVDLAEGRLLLTGTSTIHAVDLANAKLFEIPLGDAFTFEDAVAVRVDPGSAPHLAVVASAPRGVERWRLIILSSDQEVIYDEVLNASPTIFTARRPDGADTLLVAFPYDDQLRGLWTLRIGS